MYTLTRYVNEIYGPILRRYKEDNAWFKWWPKHDTVSVWYGWQMYKTSSTNALGFLLLGDTAIRTNKALLLNFGLTSAHGVQEKKDKEMIDQLMKQRQGFARPGMAATHLLGPGSILSDKDWSPLLNDSFILGGIIGCQDFHLADEGFDGFTAPVMAPQPMVAQRAAFRADAKEKWKAYFQANPKVFWDSTNNVPRVFCRETIGLMTFGYQPVFTSQELGFECADQGKARHATFTAYLSALRAVSFQNSDRRTIMGAISIYLFGAAGILT
jgi:hypothetical protein